MHTWEGTAGEKGLNLTMQNRFCSHLCIGHYAENLHFSSDSTYFYTERLKCNASAIQHE